MQIFALDITTIFSKRLKTIYSVHFIKNTNFFDNLLKKVKYFAPFFAKLKIKLNVLNITCILVL